MAQLTSPGTGPGRCSMRCAAAGPAAPAGACLRAPHGFPQAGYPFEALVEALPIEAGPLGIEAALLEPGAVSSGALDHVTSYTLPGDPYAHLLTQSGARASQMMTPEEVAAGIADAAEAPQLPLRIPLGQSASETLAARQAAPDDRPFIPGASPAARSPAA